MDTATLLRHLEAFEACDDARAWVATQPDAATAWATCPYANWIMLLLGELHVRGALPRETLVLAACACAETALCHVPAGEHRPRRAIEIARRWTRGEATVAEVSSAAAEAACAAVYSAAADAACAAVYSAAADAADAAAASAYRAAYRASYVADAADAAAALTARAAVADAVRGVVPWEIVEAALTQMEMT